MDPNDGIIIRLYGKIWNLTTIEYIRKALYELQSTFSNIISLDPHNIPLRRVRNYNLQFANEETKWGETSYEQKGWQGSSAQHTLTASAFYSIFMSGATCFSA